ncbi:MAG: S8 family serine peptidase, partial [Gemmatimonadales bacterium]
MKKQIAGIALLLAAAACADPSSPSQARSREVPAPVYSHSGGIANDYIVVLNDNVADASSAEREMVAVNFGQLQRSYRSALKGFAATLTPEAVARIAQDARVKYIEQDQVVTAITTQSSATWGIDRIDQRDLPLSTTYTYTPTGAGVTAYIIDTGI